MTLPIKQSMNKHRFWMKYWIFLGLIAFSPIFSSAEYLTPKKRKVKKSLLSTEMDLQGFFTNSNFNSQYEYDSLNHESFMALANSKLKLAYSPKKWVELSTYVNFQTHWNNHDYILLPFQPTDLGVQLSHYIRSSVFSLIPEVSASVPLVYPVDPNTHQVFQIISNDGVVKVTPSLNIQLTFLRTVIPFAKIGYQYREYLSSLLLWQGGFIYRDPQWELGFLFGGFHSIQGDVGQVGLQARQLQLGKYNLGSFKFYSVNPSSIGFSAWSDFRLNKASHLFINYNFDFYGQNYARGHSLQVGLTVSLLKKNTLPSKQYKKALRKFREKPENIDSLFEDDSDRELMREIEKLQ